MSELARRYAQALWQVSPDGEALERTARALMEEPALWEALCSPAVQAGEKGRVLAGCPGWRRAAHCRIFTASWRRRAAWPCCLRLWRRFTGWSWPGGAAPVRADLCAPAGGGGAGEAPGGLCRLHHKKEIVFDVRTDPALLGGFTLDIEGVRYDKSVRGRWAGWAANWKRGEWHESKTGRDCLRPAGGDSEL